MKIAYVSCFKQDDPAEAPLTSDLENLASDEGIDIASAIAQDADSLWACFESLPLKTLDVLIIGGHGHGSLSGFIVGNEPVRWHGLARRLSGRLPESCTLIFYSCNGAFLGIGHIFSKGAGPDYVFGPYIGVDPDAMAYAARAIIAWKKAAGGAPDAACKLVNKVNKWARRRYQDRYDQSFLRVPWYEHPYTRRHPTKPSSDKFDQPLIPLKGI
jgi:hypothetical protein